MSNAFTPFLNLIDTLINGLGHPRHKAPLQSLEEAIRTAAHEHQALQGALARAAVTERREAEQLETLIAEITALEGRAILAIQGGRQDLAERAAESLAMLEVQRVAQSAVCVEARTTVRNLRQRIDADRIRLQKLNHGRELAKIRAIAPPLTRPLANAEDLLATINATDVAASLDAQPRQIAQELAEAGFGPSHRSDVAAILERLQAAAQASDNVTSVPMNLTMIQRPPQL